MFEQMMELMINMIFLKLVFNDLPHALGLYGQSGRAGVGEPKMGPNRQVIR
jgi:hypothetical protein